MRADEERRERETADSKVEWHCNEARDDAGATNRSWGEPSAKWGVGRGVLRK
jgi:hypothetical protein